MIYWPSRLHKRQRGRDRERWYTHLQWWLNILTWRWPWSDCWCWCNPCTCKRECGLWGCTAWSENHWLSLVTGEKTEHKTVSKWFQRHEHRETLILNILPCPLQVAAQFRWSSGLCFCRDVSERGSGCGTWGAVERQGSIISCTCYMIKTQWDWGQTLILKHKHIIQWNSLKVIIIHTQM